MEHLLPKNGFPSLCFILQSMELAFFSLRPRFYLLNVRNAFHPLRKKKIPHVVATFLFECTQK